MHLAPFTSMSMLVSPKPSTLPRWGAGGPEAPCAVSVAKVPVPTYDRAEHVAYAKKLFRNTLVKNYLSVLGGWRAMDVNNRGKLSFLELCRGCRTVGFAGNVRDLWCALDSEGSGYANFAELDVEQGAEMAELARCIGESCRSVQRAWQQHFNPIGVGRIQDGDFEQGCQAVGYGGDPDFLYDTLCVDKAPTGLSIKEFSFLEAYLPAKRPPPEKRYMEHRHGYMAPKLNHKISPWHKKAEIAMTARVQDPLALPPAQAPKPSGKAEFKKLLINEYGNILRAWRLGMDADHNGKLDWREFQKACANVGFAGNRKELWSELDGDGSGYVSLAELDEAVAKQLDGLLGSCLKRFPSWEVGWQRTMDRRGDDKVPAQFFVEGARVWGFGGDAEKLFDKLDLDRVGYLTLEMTSWIARQNALTEEAEEGPRSAITRSYLGKIAHQERERRDRYHRFKARNRASNAILQPMTASASLESLRPAKEKPDPMAKATINERLLTSLGIDRSPSVAPKMEVNTNRNEHPYYYAKPGQGGRTMSTSLPVSRLSRDTSPGRSPSGGRGSYQTAITRSPSMP